MPAKLFFEVLRQGRRLHVEERGIFMAQLVDVAAVGGVASMEQYKELKRIHNDAAFGPRKRKVFKPKEHEMVASILASAFWAGRNRGV